MTPHAHMPAQDGQDVKAGVFQVGHRVRAKEAIYEPADDHAPGGYVCMKGDLLIVRAVRAKGQWPLSVSHEDVTDNSFACGVDEVVPDGANGGNDAQR